MAYPGGGRAVREKKRALLVAVELGLIALLRWKSHLLLRKLRMPATRARSRRPKRKWDHELGLEPFSRRWQISAALLIEEDDGAACDHSRGARYEEPGTATATRTEAGPPQGGLTEEARAFVESKLWLEECIWQGGCRAEAQAACGDLRSAERLMAGGSSLAEKDERADDRQRCAFACARQNSDFTQRAAACSAHCSWCHEELELARVSSDVGGCGICI